MRKIAVLMLFCMLAISAMEAFPQDTTFRFIFVPHARTEATSGDMIITGIRNIDFTKFSLKMLGGDLCQTTSKDSATMAYCDKFFDLGNINTLWALGNHDIESGSRAMITKFTKRNSYYAYARDGIQFLILDTELDAPSFSSSSITGAQLDTVTAVCNRVTSADTKFFIVLNSRYLWMVNNPDFTQAFKDSNIAASSKSMTTTNFSKDVYPLLQKVKAKGIQVMWFSGDKSRTNVENYFYNKADSIPFFAAKMENSDPDSTNYVIILTYTKNKKMKYDYVRLTNVNKFVATEALPNPAVAFHNSIAKEPVFKVRQAGSRKMNVLLQTGNNANGVVQIFSINGALCQSMKVSSNETRTIPLNKAGMYVLKASSGNARQIIKFAVQ